MTDQAQAYIIKSEMNKVFALVTQAISNLPLEKLFVHRTNPTKDLKELEAILGEAGTSQARPASEPVPKDERWKLEPRQQRGKVRLQETKSDLTTAETVAYQNRELAKNLVVLERHYAQKLTINGKKCDCGAGRHLLAIESLAEETISMVENPSVYYRLIDWEKDVSPKSTDRAAKSGHYDEEYPIFSRQARGFRKELLGSLDPSSMFTKKLEDLPSSRLRSEKEGAEGEQSRTAEPTASNDRG